MNSFNYALSLWGCSLIQDITNKIQSFNDKNSPQGKSETVMFSDLSFGVLSRIGPVDKVVSGASMWYNNHKEG